MPGNWILILAAVGYLFVVPAESSVAIGWTTVIVLLVLAVLGELL